MKMIADDLKLLKGMEEDDNSSFKAIYDKYSKALFLYAHNVIKDRAVCEDIIQEIFISLWAKRKTNKITSLKPYLFQAVKFKIFNHFRDNKFSREDLTRLNIIDVSMNVSQKLEYSELDQIIRDHVAKLPKRCRHIFVLSRYHHKTNKEIAEELEISVQAVKNQISKALAFLRNNLQLEEAIAIALILLN
ncbi:RNA polymerase sigma-70 factor [Zobellia amurskyensis]|uniref:RNA polymerase sigma-70 factor n=1 Tax=Zobellia amurskyensis TaxID=248905 RepID=A0A7X2ZWU6_9FLAO|nr:RNA polymerase sigma-70 factor [Zobellia amurskyensis]MUH37837.1 RNA polymerase sigma-70 factor [Zobellia amurskyensis]